MNVPSEIPRSTHELGSPFPATRIPRLLAVGPLPPPVNGLSKAFSFVVQALPAHGWDVRVVDVADRGAQRAGSSFSAGRLGTIGGALARAAAKAISADVIYLTISQSRLGFAKDLLIIRWAAILGRPAVAHMHGGNFSGFYTALTRPERFLVRTTLDRLAAIIVLTPGLKADFRMTRDWQARTVAISNICDTPTGTPRTWRNGQLRLLYLSALVVSKGYRETILALRQLACGRPDLRLHLDVAGACLPERDFANVAAQVKDFNDLVAALPSNATATYHGVVGGALKETLLAGADVFLLPTGYVNEGQPIAVIEALRAGLPVVASDWRGIRETIPEGMHSLLVPPRDVSALRDRIELLGSNPAMFEAMSRLALAHAENFRPGQHFDSVHRVLARALRPGEPIELKTKDSQHG